MMKTERIPLFPLPDTVFFPGTFLNLLIFEDRYLEMMRDILDGSGRIAVTLASGTKPEASLDSVALGDVHPVLTIGSIRRYEPIPEDRYEVSLFGERRGRIRAERFEKPYREVIVEPLSDDSGGDAQDVATAREELLARYEQLFASSSREVTAKVDTEDVTFETLVNAVPSLLNLPVGERQRLLEMDSVLQRCYLTTQYFDRVLSTRGGVADLDEDDEIG